MICNCNDWKENTPILQEGEIAAGGYRGKFFTFCPWCGLRLMKIEVDETGAMKAQLTRKHF